MSSPLIESMIAQYRYPLLTKHNIERFIHSHTECVLFLTENPQRFPESDDVAVVLPELARAFDYRFDVGVIDRSIQRELQKRYGFTEWPTLVFLRKGQYLGAISRIRDWLDYLHEIKGILASKPRHPPRQVIPVTPIPTASNNT